MNTTKPIAEPLFTPLEQMVLATRQYESEQSALRTAAAELDTAQRQLKQKQEIFDKTKRACFESESRIALIAKKF